MKRFNTLSTLFLFAMAIHAQVELTIETTAGELKNVLTEEQKETVTDLTLTGSMNDSDLYFIGKEMPKLKTLDMKEVDVDSIPIKAFYNSPGNKYILPKNLIYVGDSAFKHSSIYITGQFPKLGDASFSYDSRIIIDEDNIYCKQETRYDDIYSIDGKIMYYSQGYSSIIEEGTETIESHAFNGIGIEHISIPSTLKLIKEHAFFKFEPLFYNSSYDYGKIRFISNAEIPPTLEKNAFVSDNLSEFMLLVPNGKVEVYKKADPQWLKFYSITETSGIANQKSASDLIFITKDNEGITINSEKSLLKIQVYSFSGECCLSKNDVGTETYIPEFNNKGIYLLKVVFEDDTSSYLKIII